MTFKDDKEAMDFLRRFLASDFWKWLEKITVQRQDYIFNLLQDPKTTSDGRAMLTGRLLEIRNMLNFPVNTLAFIKAEKEQEDSKAEKIIGKTAFPDVVTH